MANRSSSIIFVGTTSTRDPAAVLAVLLRATETMAPVVVTHLERPPALTLDGKHAVLAQVDHVADEQAEGLGDAQAHDALQPERQLVHGVHMGSDAGALGQGERAGLAGRRAAASRGRVREWCFEALGGVEAGGKRPLARAKARIRRRIHRASATTRLDSPKVWRRFEPGICFSARARDPDVTLWVAVCAGELAVLPTAPHRRQAESAQPGRLGETDLPTVLTGCPGCSEPRRAQRRSLVYYGRPGGAATRGP